MTIRDAEKQLIIRALEEANGNRAEAARRVGISRRTFYRKLKEYQLEHL
jgi:transcriptional regulator of acetoin/glycerol metabolism